MNNNPSSDNYYIFRSHLEEEKRQLEQLSRTELEDRITRYCFDSKIDLLTLEELAGLDDDVLRTMVSLVDDELFTLFRDHRRDANNENDKRHCHLLKSLFDYIKVQAIAVEPITRRPYSVDERMMILTAMKVFFPERMEEIRQAEEFVVQHIPPIQPVITRREFNRLYPFTARLERDTLLHNLRR